MIRWRMGLVLVGCGLMVLASVPSVMAAAPTTRAAMPVRPVSEFVMVSESQAQSAAFGMLMICPSHAHGTPDEAEKKLRLLLKGGSDQPATIWVCRGSQMETLMRFAPLVERVVVNPFGHLRAERPRGGELYWPGRNHPLLNGLAEIRLAAGDRQLLACLDLDGEAGLFGRRSPTFEEIEWQVYAAIGSGYQGLVWRNLPGDAERASRLKSLEGRLREMAVELGVATPGRGVRASGGQPVAVLRGKGVVFVVLLNPDYLVLGPRMELGGGVRFPLEDQEQRGEVELTLAKGCAVGSARTLSGRGLSTKGGDGRVVIPYRFRGGGEMVICRLLEGVRTAEGAE